MIFSFITLFPSLIEGYFSDSILKNARNKRLITIDTIALRDFALDSYKSADAKQIGGGAGQVLLPEVLQRAIDSVCKRGDSYAQSRENPAIQTHTSAKNLSLALAATPKPHIIFLTPCAKPFSQDDAIRLAKKEHIVFVCGRYEGIDERAIERYADEVFSVGDFILTGGELAALCLCDSISRQIPQVLGNSESLQGESFESCLLEAPIFARTQSLAKGFENFAPISEYSKGNHSRICALKNQLALCKTRYFRPDLFERWKFTQRVHDEK